MKNVSTVGCTAFTHSSRGDGLNGDDDGGRRRNRAWAARKREVRLEAAAAATSGLADSWTSPQGADDQLGTTAGSVQRSEGVDANATRVPKKGKVSEGGMSVWRLPGPTSLNRPSSPERDSGSTSTKQDTILGFHCTDVVPATPWESE